LKEGHAAHRYGERSFGSGSWFGKRWKEGEGCQNEETGHCGTKSAGRWLGGRNSIGQKGGGDDSRSFRLEWRQGKKEFSRKALEKNFGHDPIGDKGEASSSVPRAQHDSVRREEKADNLARERKEAIAYQSRGAQLHF